MKNRKDNRSGGTHGTRENDLSYIDGFEGLSEVDQHILQLNHDRYSMGEISRLLKSQYGITLSKTSVSRHLLELMQDSDNDVRVNFECSIPRQPRHENRWYKIIQRLKTAISDYERVHGVKPSFRTMQYQLIDEKVIGDNESDHRNFNDATVKARLGWVDSDGDLLFPKLDIDCFADDGSRLTAGEYQVYPPQKPTERGEIPDPEEYITRHIAALKACIMEYDGIGEYGERGAPGGRWYGQMEYEEVWEEKNDLLPAFRSMLSDKHIKIRANKGYPSLIFLYKCTEELKEVINRYGLEPKNIHIKYCGDWDPSGENIDWYIRKRLKQLGIEGIDFQRIAVTPEQIEKYNLPLLSMEKKAEKKAPNPNMKEFIRRYGNKATHLNAFFIEKHFDTFKKIVGDAVDEHWDESIYQDMVDEYDIDAEDPAELDDEELENARNLMCRKVTEAFKPGWAKKSYDPDLGLRDVDDDVDETEDV